MTVKELIKALRGMPGDYPVVICDLNSDGDGENMYLPDIMGIDIIDAQNTENSDREEPVVAINYGGIN